MWRGSLQADAKSLKLPMIIAGSTQVFGIAAEITQNSDWILGRFRFVFHGRPCGNWDDEADLRGCYGWLKDFSEQGRDRFEAELLDLPAATVFERLVRPVLFRERRARVAEYYKNTFNRFHISHLGMSSFNRVDMVLIENSEIQRCVWGDSFVEEFHDDVFPSGHMQGVAAAFCKLLESEVAALGGKL